MTNKRFPLPLIDEDISEPGDEKATFRLNKPFVYVASNGQEIVIPEGFIYDGASVPKILWSVVSPVGEVKKPALVHDWFYSVQVSGRRYADDMIKESMRAYGVHKGKILLWWTILRLFGGFAWKENKRLSPELKADLLKRQGDAELWWTEFKKTVKTP